MHPSTLSPIDHSTTDDPLLTIAEVATRLRVDPTTVRRWIVQGTLSSISLPSSGQRMLGA